MTGRLKLSPRDQIEPTGSVNSWTVSANVSRIETAAMSQVRSETLRSARGSRFSGFQVDSGFELARCARLLTLAQIERCFRIQRNHLSVLREPIRSNVSPGSVLARMRPAAFMDAAQALILIEAAVTYVKSLLGGRALAPNTIEQN